MLRKLMSKEILRIREATAYFCKTNHFRAAWIGRKRLQNVQKTKQEQKQKNALFAYYYANVRPLGCHLLVVFAQASYRFLWGSKFCSNNSSLHD